MSDCRHNAPGREFKTGDVQIQRHQLDEQSSEDTVSKLVDYLYGSDGKVDIEAIDRYLEELDQAEEAPDEFDVEKGLQQFHQRFDYRLEEVKPARKRRPLARIAIIAAALCTFIFTAQASGWDILGAIAKWTSEQFAFTRTGEIRGEQQDDTTYESLQEALEFEGVLEKVCPTKFPDGTKISAVQVRKDTGNLMFSATYHVSGKKFYISIRKIAETPYLEVEINNPNVESYLAGGVKHYIMNDLRQKKVSWTTGAWECYILGDLYRSDLLVMIDSIYV